MQDASEALKAYRLDAPQAIKDALVGFHSLNAGDQRELLFFMIMHTNSNMTQALDALGMQFVANPQPRPN